MVSDSWKLGEKKRIFLWDSELEVMVTRILDEDESGGGAEDSQTPIDVAHEFMGISQINKD